MDSLKWPLVFVCLSFKVIQTEAASWTATVPSSVKGLLGSCVVIPCSFNYPQTEKKITEFTGIWRVAEDQIVYHPDKSKMIEKYRQRAKLVGDVRHKNCSLKIESIQKNDGGSFHFRIEMTGYEKYSYLENKVSITIISEPNPISFSVKEEIMIGETVSASCSVSHSCPDSPPVFTWSHPGTPRFHTEKLENGQWKATSTLSFHATTADHNKPLNCSAVYTGKQQTKISKVLKVQYPPENVRVEYKPDVKEGEAVKLHCSSDAQPPANSYAWHNETGAQLHQGKDFMLPNVSRHTGALYCTANNTIGQGRSSSAQINVLYAPEIKAASSCSSAADTVKCVCIVESKPPSIVHFVLSDRVLPSPQVENHGSITIGTLQAELGSSEFVLCLANNTQGNASIILSSTVNSKMQNIVIIATGAGVSLVILLIALGVVKKCRRSGAASSQISTTKANKDVELPRKENNYDDCAEVSATDCVYGNMEMDLDDAIYANV